MSQPARGILTPGGVRDRVATFVQEHPQYRSAFLTHPAAAIARHLGLVIPDVEVRAISDTADTVYVVVPSDPDELRDRELGRYQEGSATKDSRQCPGAAESHGGLP